MKAVRKRGLRIGVNALRGTHDGVSTLCRLREDRVIDSGNPDNDGSICRVSRLLRRRSAVPLSRASETSLDFFLRDGLDAAGDGEV